MTASVKFQNQQLTRYQGYRDLNGEFVPFELADEVFERAVRLGTRVLLRLELDDSGELLGTFYTNDQALCR